MQGHNAESDDNVTFYLEKFATKLQPRANKVEVYNRQKSDNSDKSDMSSRKLWLIINPRQRWNELYRRKSSFLSLQTALVYEFDRLVENCLSAEINTSGSSSGGEMSAHERGNKNNRENKIEVVPNSRLAMSHVETIRTRFHRQTLQPREVSTISNNKSQFMIWNQSDLLEQIDVVSGAPLCNITLLCRDMICECNHCTECSMDESCGVCDFRFYHLFLRTSHQHLTGSYREGCILPPFFVTNSSGEKVLIQSDLDYMFNKGHSVGLKLKVGLETDTFDDMLAIIETDKSPPGYLRFRGVEPENKNFLFDASSEEPTTGPKKWTTHDFNLIDKKQNGPATKKKYLSRRSGSLEHDEVLYFSCPSWPPTAASWIDRTRPHGWPSVETIQRIISMGCRIVHKRHTKSRDANAAVEYRFSFSAAEILLFDTLSLEQKQCFIAFKALVKSTIINLEYTTKRVIHLTTYHLKNLFLWACETIPADQWRKSNGWARCLLYLIEQLNICLSKRKMHGYFIYDYNLLDCFKPPPALLENLNKLRKNSLTSADAFIDSTEWFHMSYSKISESIEILHQYDVLSMERQLLFLHSVINKTEMTRNVSFWRKASMFRIFSRWCSRHSCEIQCPLCGCLSEKMTLFDVVYLDIVHGFDVPRHILLSYVERELPEELIFKLATCYGSSRFNGDNRVEYTLHPKTVAMFHYALTRKQPSLETIMICLCFLIKSGQCGITARALESADRDLAHSNEDISHMTSFTNVFSQKTIRHFEEIHNIVSCQRGMRISVPMFIHFLSAVCYKINRDTEGLKRCLNQMNKFCFDPESLNYSCLLIALEVSDVSGCVRESHRFYREYLISTKVGLIKHESQRNDSPLLNLKNAILDTDSLFGTKHLDKIKKLLFPDPRHNRSFRSENPTK